MSKFIIPTLLIYAVILVAYWAGKNSVKQEPELAPIWQIVLKSKWKLVEETENHYKFQDLTPKSNE